MPKRIQTICIIGDSPLVDEFATLAASRGFRCVFSPTASTILALELTNVSLDAKHKNLRRLDRSLPTKVPIISSSVTVTVAEQSAWLKHPERLAGIGALPTLLQGSLVEFAFSDFTNEAVRTAVRSFAESLGKECSFVQDSVGLVFPRILCSLINEACFAMGEGIADAHDIDTAMKLGTNYPDGPVHWGMQIGMQQVHAVVAALHRHFGEDRYRPAPVLQKAAFRGVL